ncbi:MAG: hypothetical protein IPL95_19965 [Saprospiraceae bacterium]|nr:hypothetical protein [Saprospiraceae bacterium]
MNPEFVPSNSIVTAFPIVTTFPPENGHLFLQDSQHLHLYQPVTGWNFGSCVDC